MFVARRFRCKILPRLFGFPRGIRGKTVLGNGQTQKASANDAFPNLDHPRSAPARLLWGKSDLQTM